MENNNNFYGNVQLSIKYWRYQSVLPLIRNLSFVNQTFLIEYANSSFVILFLLQNRIERKSILSKKKLVGKEIWIRKLCNEFQWNGLQMKIVLYVRCPFSFFNFKFCFSFQFCNRFQMIDLTIETIEWKKKCKKNTGSASFVQIHIHTGFQLWQSHDF